MVTAEETDATRSAFLKHLYYDRYEEPNALGVSVRAVHRVFHLSFSVLRRRPSDGWPALFAKWKVDGAPLLEAWREWCGVHGTDAT